MGRLERGDTGHRTYVGPAASIRFAAVSRAGNAARENDDFRDQYARARAAGGQALPENHRNCGRRERRLRHNQRRQENSVATLQLHPPDGAIAKQTSDARLNASAQPPTRTTQWMLILQRAANPGASSACFFPAGLGRRPTVAALDFQLAA